MRWPDLGKQIIKMDPDEDLYLEWSSVVEAPTFVGTRVEMATYLNEPRRGEFWYTEEQVEALLQRADEHGSSAYRPFGCTWGSPGEMYQQQGFLPRARMGEFACRLLNDQDAEPDGLLEPLEWIGP
jgi:hypothetical protein